MELINRDAFFWYCQMDKATVITSLNSEIISKETARSSAQAINTVVINGEQADSERPTDYLGIQAMLREIGGTETSRMHSGRSRQCILATLHRCFIRDRLLLVFKQLNAARNKILLLGEKYANALVPAYTNGVQAQPVTLGHLLSGYEFALQRSGERLIESYKRLNKCPLGAAALATTSFPLNRSELASWLGFDACVENAFDAAQISVVDVGLEVSQVACLIAQSLSTFIQDIHVQFHHARPWILLDHSSLLSPSTLMPQKRNPVVLNRARLAASEVIGAAFNASTVAHNVNSGMTDYKRFSSAQTLDNLSTLLYEVSDVLDGMRLDEPAALAEIEAEFSTTSELAGYLQSEHDVAYAVGHAFASKLVDYGRHHIIKLKDISSSVTQRLFIEAVKENGLSNIEYPLTKQEYDLAINPRTMVNNYCGLGGSSPNEVNRMLANSKQELVEHNNWLSSTTESLLQSERELEHEFLKLVN